MTTTNKINWIEALKHHATDSDRVELTAERIESAATSMRENNPEATHEEIRLAEIELLTLITRYATIVIVEDHLPQRGHYYHDTTPELAISAAKRMGCHAAEALCYVTERATCPRNEAVQIIPFGRK